MLYELIPQWMTQRSNGPVASNREVINELARFIKSLYPDDKRVTLVTRHKFGAWFVETVITDSCVNHFNDYQWWADGRPEAELEAIIKDYIAELATKEV